MYKVNLGRDAIVLRVISFDRSTLVQVFGFGQVVHSECTELREFDLLNHCPVLAHFDRRIATFVCKCVTNATFLQPAQANLFG